MTQQRPIDLILSELGATMGMENLTFDENGGCILQFDETMNVLLLYEGNSEVLYLFSFVGEIPEGKESVVMRHLLEANYRWEGSGGATLSLRKDEGNVVLTHKLLVASLTREALEQTLSEFVTALEKWMSYLGDSDGVTADVQASKSPNGVPPSAMIRA